MILDQERLEQFVKVWQVCTLAEVAQKFGISKRDASAIATILRKKGGVKLRDHRQAHVEWDYETLERIAREAVK